MITTKEKKAELAEYARKIWSQKYPDKTMWKLFGSTGLAWELYELSVMPKEAINEMYERFILSDN